LPKNQVLNTTSLPRWYFVCVIMGIMARSKFLPKIKIDDKEYVYTESVDCLICTAKDDKGQKIRFEIDKILAGGTIVAAKAIIKDRFNIQVTKEYLRGHIDRHSSYIRELRKDIKAKEVEKITGVITKVEEKHMEAEEVINLIIDKGGNAIANGEMYIDSKLLLGALKEQGIRQKYGSLTELLDNMDKERFLIGSNKVVQEAEVNDSKAQKEEELT